MDSEGVRKQHKDTEQQDVSVKQREHTKYGLHLLACSEKRNNIVVCRGYLGSCLYQKQGELLMYKQLTKVQVKVAKIYAQKEDIDFHEAFSLIVKKTMLCVLFAVIAVRILELHQTTFLHDDIKETYMKQLRV